MSSINYQNVFSALNTVIISHSAFEHALSHLQQNVRTARRYAEPDISLLLGCSRSGKTRLLELVEQEKPAYRTCDQVIRPIVRLKITKKPTPNGVITQLLNALGDPLYGKGTETIKLIRLVGLLKKLEVQVIMLDEFQHFVSESGYVNFEVADLFKLLSDEARVNLILAGLPEAYSVIESNEQLAGRSMRPVHLRRFDWTIAGDRSEFMSVVNGYATAMAPLALPNFSDEEWGFRWYCATGGHVGYVAKLYRTLADSAARDARSSIELKDLDAAHRTAINAPNPANVHPFSVKFSATGTAVCAAYAMSIGQRMEPNRPATRRSAGKRPSVATNHSGSDRSPQ